MDEDKELEELKERLKAIEKKKEIADLKSRIAKLEGNPRNQSFPGNVSPLAGSPLSYKPLEQNLSSGLSEIGSQIGNIPHIVIGKKQNTIQQPEIFNEKEQKFMNKFKKWAIILGVIVVVGYAAYRILESWLFK